MENVVLVTKKPNEDSRVWHIDPVYVEGQVHTFGLEQVPPFEHEGEQTAK